MKRLCARGQGVLDSVSDACPVGVYLGASRDSSWARVLDVYI